MDIKPLSRNFSISEQLTPDDVAAAAAVGIRTIVNNRLDGETPGQPPSTRIRRAALLHGINYHHLPVLPGNVHDEEVTEFSDILANTDEPVLGYCRTGTRAATLWALSQSSIQSVGEILDATEHAGCDLENLRPRLESQASPVGATNFG